MNAFYAQRTFGRISLAKTYFEVPVERQRENEREG